jgi:hypothetical protein
MKPLHYFFLIATAIAAIAASGGGPATQVSPSQTSSINAHATDGAFRDGMFMGHEDRSRALPHHVAYGRWTTPADRESFIQGYEQGYGTVAP